MRRRIALALLTSIGVAGCGAEPPAGDGPEAGSPAARHPLTRPADFAATAPEAFRVRFETTAGAFVVQVYRAWAPLGADRFYGLVRGGYYDGIPFHRVLDGFVADFGIHPDPWVNAAWRQALLTDDPVLESNRRGRMSFSKGGPHRRTVQVFVNLRDNAELDDQGFAPFGEVIEGMETVDALYSGYGDGPPRGEGVYQAMAIARGEDYFAEFPLLDRVVTARVVEG